MHLASKSKEPSAESIRFLDKIRLIIETEAITLNLDIIKRPTHLLIPATNPLAINTKRVNKIPVAYS